MDAFYFDDPERRHKSRRTLFREFWNADRYGMLVRFRLMQYCFKRQHDIYDRLDDLPVKKISKALPFRPGLAAKILVIKLKAKFYGNQYLHFEKKIRIHSSCSFSPHARIDRGFWGAFLAAGITGDAVIGKNFMLNARTGILGDREKAAVIGDNVVVHANASILGGVEIGDNAIIGANSLVIRSVPAGATVIGVPAKIVFQRSVQTDTTDKVDPAEIT